MTRSQTGPQMVHLGSDEQARGMWGCGLRVRYMHGTQEAPPTQTSNVLASWSFPAGAQCEVQRGVRGERGVEHADGWAGAVGRGG